MTKGKSTHPAQKILESYIPLRSEREALEITLEECSSEQARALYTKTIRDNKQLENNVVELISRATNPLHREALTRHYIAGETWAIVAEKMNYSERQVYRMHLAALKAISE